MVDDNSHAGRAGVRSGNAGENGRGCSGAEHKNNASALAAGRRGSDAEPASKAALQGAMRGATTGDLHDGEHAILPSRPRPSALETAGSEFASHLMGALGIVSGGGTANTVPSGKDFAEAGTSVSTAADSFERGASNNRSQAERSGMQDGATTIASSTATVSQGAMGIVSQKSNLRIDTANCSSPNTLHKSPTGSPGKPSTGANTGRAGADVRRRSAATHTCTCARAELTYLFADAAGTFSQRSPASTSSQRSPPGTSYQRSPPVAGLRSSLARPSSIPGSS